MLNFGKGGGGLLILARVVRVCSVGVSTASVEGVTRRNAECCRIASAHADIVRACNVVCARGVVICDGAPRGVSSGVAGAACVGGAGDVVLAHCVRRGAGAGAISSTHIAESACRAVITSSSRGYLWLHAQGPVTRRAARAHYSSWYFAWQPMHMGTQTMHHPSGCMA